MMRFSAVAGNSCLACLVEFVNRIFDSVLISESEIFVNLLIKRGVRKLPQSFFLVKIDQSSKQLLRHPSRLL